MVRYLALSLALTFPVQAVTLTPDSTVILRGEITEQSVANATLKLLQVETPYVVLYINSPGGSVFAGMQLMTVIANLNKEVICVANTAASMAFVILQACTKRYVMDHSILMQHVASYGISGGDAPNNRSLVEFFDNILVAIDKQQAKRLKIPLSTFREKVRNDWWAFGTQAVKENMADKLVAVTCSKELIHDTYTETIYFFTLIVDVTWSACPLVEEPLAIQFRQTIGSLPEAEFKSLYQRFLLNLSPRKAILQRITDGTHSNSKASN